MRGRVAQDPRESAWRSGGWRRSSPSPRSCTSGGRPRGCGSPSRRCSQTIRKLERELGVTLFDRSTRSVALTPAGQALLPHAHRVFEELELGAPGDAGGVRGLLRHGQHRLLRCAEPPHAAAADPRGAAPLPGRHAQARRPGDDPRRRRAGGAGRAGPRVRRAAARPLAGGPHAADRAGAAGRRAAGRPPAGARARRRPRRPGRRRVHHDAGGGGVGAAGGRAARLRGRRVPAPDRAGDHRPVHDPHAGGGRGRASR